MGALAEKAKEKSPYIRINVGEETAPLKYKSWKEIQDSFGHDSFRYFFEQETPHGFVTKTFDNRSQSFAEQMDKIPFNATVIISRHQKVDKDGNIVENKSTYKVTLAGKEVKPETSEDSPGGETPGERPGWAEEMLDEEQ